MAKCADCGEKEAEIAGRCRECGIALVRKAGKAVFRIKSNGQNPRDQGKGGKKK